MLHKLLFSPSEPEDSANVGAYLRSSDGTLITHTTDGGKERLDVSAEFAPGSSIQITDGTDTLAVNADGSINSVVTAIDLDIRDLSSATDSVSSWLSDGSGNAISSTGGALDINIASSDISIDVDEDLANTAFSTEATSVTSAATVIISSPLANRKYVWMANNGNKYMEIGVGDFAFGTGFPIPAGSLLEGRFGDSLVFSGKTVSGTADVRVLQAS